MSEILFYHVSELVTAEKSEKNTFEPQRQKETLFFSNENVADTVFPLVIGVGGAANFFLSTCIDKKINALFVHIDDNVESPPLTKGWKMRLPELHSFPGNEKYNQLISNRHGSEIRSLLHRFSSKCSKIFMIAGLGGQFGTSCLPYFVDILRESGKAVHVLVTMPFSFEGRTRYKTAQTGLEQLCYRADGIYVLELDACFQHAPHGAKVKQLFEIGSSMLIDYLQQLSIVEAI